MLFVLPSPIGSLRYSNNWFARFLSFEGSGRGRRRVNRMPVLGTKEIGSTVSGLLHLIPCTITIGFARSRDWVCPHCQQSNDSLLPGAPEPSINLRSPSTNDGTAENLDGINTGQAIPHIASVNTRPAHADPQPAPLPAAGGMTAERGKDDVRLSERQSSKWRRGNKPPALLDAAISILLVLLFAIICRRMV